MSQNEEVVFDLIDYFSPGRQGNIYFPLGKEHSNHDSIQLATFSTLDGFNVLLDEQVVKNHQYILKLYQDSVYLLIGL